MSGQIDVLMNSLNLMNLRVPLNPIYSWYICNSNQPCYFLTFKSGKENTKSLTSIGNGQEKMRHNEF